MKEENLKVLDIVGWIVVFLIVFGIGIFFGTNIHATDTSNYIEWKKDCEGGITIYIGYDEQLTHSRHANMAISTNPMAAEKWKDSVSYRYNNKEEAVKKAEAVLKLLD